jgi:surfeit locus 1 family protein
MMSPRGRRWIVLIATLIAVAVTARLGVWQLSRAAQKEALQASLDIRSALPLLPMVQLARSADEARQQHHRLTLLRGRWLVDRTVFLENRQMDGRPGFFVVTPLELAPGDAVLVQRGWAPRDPQDRSRLPVVPTAAEPVEVLGRIAPPPAALYALGTDSTGPLRQNLEVSAFEREIGTSLRPWSVYQQAQDAPDDGLQRRWPAPAVDVHKHHGYAFQWFSLATLLTLLYVWFQLIHPWRQRRPTPGR